MANIFQGDKKKRAWYFHEIKSSEILCRFGVCVIKAATSFRTFSKLWNKFIYVSIEMNNDLFGKINATFSKTSVLYIVAIIVMSFAEKKYSTQIFL